MNSNTQIQRSGKRMSSSAGFTLVEVLLATAVAAIILGAILTTYVFSVRAFKSISTYSNLHSKQRRAIEMFVRDVRAAYDIDTFNASTKTIAFNIPLTFNAAGNVLTDKTITYTFTNRALYRWDSTVANATMVATNIVTLNLTLFNHDGDNVTLDTGKGWYIATNDDTGATMVVSNSPYADTKGVQMNFVVDGSVVKGRSNENYSTAIINMRAKDAGADEGFDPWDPDI